MYDVHYVSVMTHAGNSLYVLLNLCITAMPMRIMHYVHYAAYAALYMLFSILYHLADGTNAHHKSYIYEVLDWDHPVSTLRYIVVIVVLSVIVWMLLVGLTELRQRLANKLHTSMTPSSSTSTNDGDSDGLMMENYSRQESV